MDTIQMKIKELESEHMSISRWNHIFNKLVKYKLE